VKPALPTLVKVSFQIFILRSISGAWHSLVGSICLQYYWREENVSNYGLSDSNTMRDNVVSFEAVANVPPRITAS
jgi:predicted ATP-grasp superfamily ATP-dependent carboligase